VSWKGVNRLEGKPPGYYNLIEYVADDQVPRFSIEANCPCPCGEQFWLPLRSHEEPPDGHNWSWNGDKAQPTLSPSIRRIGGCAFHGYLQGGVWSSAGDGAPLAPGVYRGGPDHPIEPRRELVPTSKPAPAPAPRPALHANAQPAPAPAGAPGGPKPATAPAPAPQPDRASKPAIDKAPPGYSPSFELRFVNGKLHQLWLSGNDPGQSAWVPIRGQ
jgi:hypothetical protein